MMTTKTYTVGREEQTFQCRELCCGEAEEASRVVLDRPCSTPVTCNGIGSKKNECCSWS